MPLPMLRGGKMKKSAVLQPGHKSAGARQTTAAKALRLQHSRKKLPPPCCRQRKSPPNKPGARQWPRPKRRGCPRPPRRGRRRAGRARRPKKRPKGRLWPRRLSRRPLRRKPGLRPGQCRNRQMPGHRLAPFSRMQPHRPGLPRKMRPPRRAKTLRRAKAPCRGKTPRRAKALRRGKTLRRAKPPARHRAEGRRCAGEEDGAAQPAQEEAQPKTGKRSKRARKRHYFAFYVAVCTGVVVLASALSIFVMFFVTGNPLFSTTQDVELPNFYNMTQEEIEADEAYSSFRIEFVDVYSDEVAEGHVVDQSPKPPKEVKENARITVRVSKGVEQVEVPDMVGWTRTSASEKVKSINLSILIKYETDDSKPYNTVLSTSPAAGTVMEAGETLTVYINREELAVGTTIAPNCVGLSQSAAGRLLTSRGLSYSFIKVDSASPEGYVVSQSPRSGESMAQGGSVTLRVSNGLGSGDGTIQDPNVADGSVTGHHHTWVAWQDGHWICTVCNAVK